VKVLVGLFIAVCLIICPIRLRLDLRLLDADAHQEMPDRPHDIKKEEP
jgi:hypothetical protein